MYIKITYKGEHFEPDFYEEYEIVDEIPSGLPSTYDKTHGTGIFYMHEHNQGFEFIDTDEFMINDVEHWNKFYTNIVNKAKVQLYLEKL